MRFMRILTAIKYLLFQ